MIPPWSSGSPDTRRAPHRGGLRCAAGLCRGLDVAHDERRWTGPVLSALHPRRKPASPAPLVVMMHGGFGSAQQAERAYGWDELADSAKFVVVAYPDGVGRAWNVGGCCGRPGRENIDDSNGGMLAYALACNTGTFAAIGPDSATQLDKCAAPHPTSAMHIHGIADPRIRYEGDPGHRRSRGLPGGWTGSPASGAHPAHRSR
jgi:poly(3-hydroxybutyrate) depolymerase